jgi:hypothetical protein
MTFEQLLQKMKYLQVSSLLKKNNNGMGGNVWCVYQILLYIKGMHHAGQPAWPRHPKKFSRQICKSTASRSTMSPKNHILQMSHLV